MTYIPPVNGGRVNATISGNTAGAGALISTGTMTLAGGNNITLSQNGNAITISGGAGGAFSAGMSNIGNTSGTTGLASNQLVLAGGNNVTLSQSTAAGGNTVTISAGGGGGVAIANSQTTFTSGTANFIEGSGAITINSTTGQSFKFNVPQTSSLAATGAVSVATNGSTISIGAPIATTLSRFEYAEGLFSSLNTVVNGSLSLNHLYIPFNVTGTAIKIAGSLSALTNTSATTASANISLWMGIYTLSGSTLSLASSGSANNGFQWSQSASSTANVSINGMRQMTAPVNINITPGEYWIGALMTSATTYTGASFTVFGNNQIATTASGAVLMPIGINSSATSAMRDAMLMQGIYSTTTAALPTSIANTQINNYSSSYVYRANFYNAIYNATY
jgi:hypothetical protein